MSNQQDNTNFTLAVTKENTLAKAWLFFGVGALTIAGLFAVLLVFARTPYFQAIVPWKDFFRTALIIHVNLSVLVWLLSFAGFLWSIASNKQIFFSWLALITSISGVTLFTISPFIYDGTPLLNNYVPILQNPYFLWGIGIFGAGITFKIFILLMRLTFSKYSLSSTKESAQRFGIYSSVFITGIAILSFLWSFEQLSKPEIKNILGAEEYYELLFWGSGHIIQFAYVQLMLVAWLWIASGVGLKINLGAKTLIAIFALNILFVLPTPYIYHANEITDFEHIDFFTKQRMHSGGVASIIIGLFILPGLFKKIKEEALKPQYNALISSIILFGVGGFLGYSITEINTVIPAHYHGSIVGVTLALMGLTYHLMPKLGFAEITGKMAKSQAYLYGGGQLLHIIGLAWSGGYGALRKTPGAMESLEGKAAMGLMGFGGLVSIIGGLFFVIVIFRAIFFENRRKKA